MIVRRVATVVVALSLLFLTPFAFSGSSQDSDQDRVSNLETRVADLEAAVFGITASATPNVSTPAWSTSGDTVSVNGIGTKVVGPFHLEAGRYAVTISADSQSPQTGFKAAIYLPSGSFKTVANVSISGPATYTAAVVFIADESGDYYVATSETDAAWILTFDPL